MTTLRHPKTHSFGVQFRVAKRNVDEQCTIASLFALRMLEIAPLPASVLSGTKLFLAASKDLQRKIACRAAAIAARGGFTRSSCLAMTSGSTTVVAPSPAEELVEDAVAGYFGELAQVRRTLDTRYDDVKSGKVKVIPVEEVRAFFRAKSAPRRSQNP